MAENLFLVHVLWQRYTRANTTLIKVLVFNVILYTEKEWKGKHMYTKCKTYNQASDS